MSKESGDKNDALALPLRAVEVSAPGSFQFGWCAVDANDRVLGYCMTEAQAKQLVAPFAASHVEANGFKTEWHGGAGQQSLCSGVSTPSTSRESALADALQLVLDDWANANAIGDDAREQAERALSATSTTPRNGETAIEDLEQHMEANRRAATFAVVSLDFARRQAEHIDQLERELAALSKDYGNLLRESTAELAAAKSAPSAIGRKGERRLGPVDRRSGVITRRIEQVDCNYYRRMTVAERRMSYPERRGFHLADGTTKA